MNRLIVILLIFVELGCNNQNRQTVNVQHVFNDNSQTKSSAEPQLILKMEVDGGCFGLCPEYKISIYSNGDFIFNGERNVKQLGIKESKIPITKLTELAMYFENIKFFDLADSYLPGENCPENKSDSQTTHIYYRNGEQSKTIHRYQGCEGSEELSRITTLEKNIDRLINIKQWRE